MTTNAPKSLNNDFIKCPLKDPSAPIPKSTFPLFPYRSNDITFKFTHTEAIALLSVLASVCDFEDPLLLKVAAVIKEYEKNMKY